MIKQRLPVNQRSFIAIVSVDPRLAPPARLYLRIRVSARRGYVTRLREIDD